MSVVDLCAVYVIVVGLALIDLNGGGGRGVEVAGSGVSAVLLVAGRVGGKVKTFRTGGEDVGIVVEECLVSLVGVCRIGLARGSG